MANTAVPIGYWRSVYAPQTAFANECFLDEIADAMGKLGMRRHTSDTRSVSTSLPQNYPISQRPQANKKERGRKCGAPRTP